MKNVLKIILISIISSSMAFANKYETAMESALQKLYAANSLETYIEVASTFERIGVAEKSEWLPFYYAGLGYIWSSHQTQDGATIDSYLDKAQKLIDNASELSANNDEIITLQGYIYMMKVVVDPMSRGPEFSGRAMQEFQKAAGMNSENPRALLMLGRMQMGTDQFFGNDLSESCGMISKATQMFENQTAKDKLNPSWGQEMAIMFMKECNSN